MEIQSNEIDRPGCVTLYALLLWIVTLVYILGSLSLGLSTMSSSSGAGGAVLLIGCGLLFAAIPALTGIGLWQMKKWAWWLVIILQSLGMVFSLLSLAGGMVLLAAPENGVNPSGQLCGTVVGLVISGYILYWFITNRALFDAPAKYETVVGPGGQVIQKEVQSGDSPAVTIVVIGGVVAILCLIPIVVIAILTLMGPQIGNVFSRIVVGLGAPAP